MSVSGHRICRLAEQASAATVPAEALGLVKELRHEIDDFERQQVAQALTAGETVSAIARALGVSRQSAHRRFRDLVPARMRSKRPSPTPEARLVVEYARREAREMAITTVGSEHLVLGVLRSGDHPAAARLNGLGITLDAARTAALSLQESGREHSEIDREIKRVLEEALHAARRDGADRVGVEHILTGALCDPAGGATRMLRALGVTPDEAGALVEG